MPFPAPECPSGIVAKVFPCEFKIIRKLEKFLISVILGGMAISDSVPDSPPSASAF